MIITLEETKQFLKDIPDEEDALVTTLISAAETYLYNATGNTFDGTNSLAKLFCWVLVIDWYENRKHVGKASDKVRPIVESMLAQLKHCYQPDPEVME